MWQPSSDIIVTAKQRAAQDSALLIAQVDNERDRRLALGFTFNRKTFQGRDQDLANINGAVSIATVAVMQGSKPGDLYWAGPQPFFWLTSTNEQVPMDAHTVLSFGAAALAHKAHLVWKARSIKNAILDGTFSGDITADPIWY